MRTQAAATDSQQPPASSDARTTAQAPAPAWGMPSFDVYGQIHKGLRFALTDLLVRMGHASGNDLRTRHRIVDDLDAVLELLDGHAAHEDAHLHAALEPQLGPPAGAELYRRHERLDGLASEVRAYASAYMHASEAHEPGAFRALYLAFSRFVGEHLIHMTDEELNTQAELEQFYSADELIALHQRLLRSVAPSEMLTALYHMCLGLPAPDRATLLLGARPTMPEHAFVNLLARVLPQLQAGDRSALLEALRTTS